MRTKRDIVTEYLVLAAQAGGMQGEHAFGQIMRLWDRPLRAFVYRQTGRQDTGDDLLQEIWLAIAQGLTRLDDPTRFAPWAYRIARNRSIDAIRKQQHYRRVFSTRELTGQEHGEAPRIGTGTAVVQESDDGRDRPEDDVRALLTRLPLDQRQLLTMHYLDEFSVRDMALILDIPEGTVKSRLFHTRQHVKKYIEKQQKEGLP